tara:strand:+ start:165923 stop:166042 length:120 start_codon:yes stop_codon:yes gene_type:complete
MFYTLNIRSENKKRLEKYSVVKEKNTVEKCVVKAGNLES